MGLGFAPEGRHLFSGLTVEDNLLMGAFQRKNDKSIKEDLDLVYSLFKVLKGYRKKYAGNLSGGEQQRVGIARAVVNKPPLLLADEPTGNLDEETGSQVLTLLDKLTRQAGKNLIMVTHSRENAIYADRIFELQGGCLVEAETEIA